MRGYVDGAPTDEKSGTENVLEATAAIRALVKAAPRTCASSTPETPGAPLTICVGSRSDDQHVQAVARYARLQTRSGSLTARSTEKPGGTGSDSGDAVTLQRPQLSYLPTAHTQFSQDVPNSTGVLYHQRAHCTIAPPPRRAHYVLSYSACGAPPLPPTAMTDSQQQQQHELTQRPVPPSALRVALPDARTRQPPSLQRSANSRALSLTSSTLCAHSVERQASLSTSISQPATQQTRSSSPSLRSPTPLDLTAPPKRHPARCSDTMEAEEAAGDVRSREEEKSAEWRGGGTAAPLKSFQPQLPRRDRSSQSAQQRPRRLSFSGPSAAASEDNFVAESAAEADRLDEACVAPSPSAPHPAVLDSDDGAAGAPAVVQAATNFVGESKPEGVSTLVVEPTLQRMASVTVPPASLTLAGAVVEEPRHLSQPLLPCSAPLMDLGSPVQLRERQRPSLAAPPSMRSRGGGSGEKADGALPCVPLVVPTHESVFFPMGTDVIAPVLLHYLTVAGWSTIAGGRDYFSHRRLRGGEVAGHTVLWLHTAKPRDRFVFLVTPVLNREEAELECDTATAAEQHQRWKPSSIARASQTASGGGGNGSPSPNGAPHGHTRVATPAARWGWDKTAKLLQELRTRVFGESPWFTYTAKAAYACSRITHVDRDDSLSVSDATTPSRDSLSDSSDGSGGDDNDGITGSVGGSRVSSHDALWGSPDTQGSAPSLYLPLPHAQAAATSGGSVHEGNPPYSVSAAPMARQSPRTSPSSVMSVASSPPNLSPLAVGLTLLSPSRKRAATHNTSQDIVSVRSSSALAPPSAGLAPPWDKRHCGIYRSYVWSPVTGTAIAATVTSPATPPHSPSSLIPAVASPKAANTSKLPVGVEVVVVAHADVTAMDYAPRLTSHRLSIEAKAAHTYFFRSLRDALVYYQCEDAMVLMEEQWAAGVTSQIPRPRAATPRYQQQQSDHVSAASCSSERRCAKVRVACSPSHGEPFLREDGESSITVASAPRESPREAAETHARRDGDFREAERRPCGSAAAESSKYDMCGGEAARGSTGVDVDLCRSPFGSHRHRPWPPSPPSQPDLLSNVKSMGSIDDSGSLMPSASTATSPMAAPRRLHHRPPQHPPPSCPRGSPKSSFSMHHGMIATQGRAERSVSRSGTHSSGRAGLSGAISFRPSPSLPRSTAGSRFTTASGSVVPSLGLTVGPQSSGQFPVQPRLTSSHGEVVVSVYTADPVFNTVLRELLVPEQGTHPYTWSVAEQKRLLSMVEVGMPAWSIFYSSTGLPYRRLFRLLYSGLTNLWPLLSLAVGLYDLYKHLPQLKSFMEHTLEPITRWVERRFTIRVSVLVTYLISVAVNIFSSLSSFVAQFYLVQLFSLPIVQLALALLKLPFVIAFDAVWALATTVLATFSLTLQVVRVVVMAPLVLVMNVASLRETCGAALPLAVEGTSMSVKWWRAWVEFWETVASPMKNAARAWWDSMMHFSTSAARRETSIRRWTSPKLEQLAIVVGEVQDCLAINAQLWWSYILLPGIECKVLLSVTLVYMYWLFLGISPELWDEVIYASGARRLPPLRADPSASHASAVSPTIKPASPAASSPFTVTPAADGGVGAQFKGGSLDVCDDSGEAPGSACSASFGSRLFPLFHSWHRDGKSCSSPSSAGMRPPSTACTDKSRTSAGSSGTSPLAVHLQSQQAFSALVAELLLPNMVLELLHHVRGALALGCSGAVAFASRMTTCHAKVVLSNSSGEAFNKVRAVLNTSSQCSWTEALDEVFLRNHTAAEAVALITGVSMGSGREKGQANPLIVHMRRDSSDFFADSAELRRIWQAVVLAKWGDTVGRETPRVAVAAKVEASQDDATAVSNAHVEETRS
ncbi:hypothetical protein LSCM1_06889 [Leishmania martiniquensis]|uniref:Transmembrane protein n=1 Tax=Leishmania martiniquensis TaxID=1580590 RepID=A0A836KRG3_9TRYP|nr:hypothetical protein LSCM1_06889 [Leishmania martiniquensis]